MIKKVLLKAPMGKHEKYVKKHKRGSSFIVFLFFLLTFSLSRAWVYLATNGLIPDSLVNDIRGIHIHHFAYGILLNSFIGYLALALPRRYLEVWKIKLSALFGVGLGWTFDEFAMWLRLDEDYWLRQSYDAIVIVGIILLNVAYFSHFWRRIAHKIAARLRRSSSELKPA